MSIFEYWVNGTCNFQLMIIMSWEQSRVTSSPASLTASSLNKVLPSVVVSCQCSQFIVELEYLVLLARLSRPAEVNKLRDSTHLTPLTADFHHPHSRNNNTVLYCTVLYCTVLYCSALHTLQHKSSHSGAAWFQILFPYCQRHVILCNIYLFLFNKNGALNAWISSNPISNMFKTQNAVGLRELNSLCKIHFLLIFSKRSRIL